MQAVPRVCGRGVHQRVTKPGGSRFTNRPGNAAGRSDDRERDRSKIRNSTGAFRRKLDSPADASDSAMCRCRALEA
jgi:hypothetical protein